MCAHGGHRTSGHSSAIRPLNFRDAPLAAVWQVADGLPKEDFHNYKGWHSTLLVAFVDSAYLFRGASVGYAGRTCDKWVFLLPLVESTTLAFPLPLAAVLALDIAASNPFFNVAVPTAAAPGEYARREQAADVSRTCMACKAFRNTHTRADPSCS